MAQDNIITRILVIGLVAVALVLAIYPQGTQTGREKTITVFGDSSKEVMADQAKAFVRVYTLDKDAKVSQDQNTAISNRVIAALKGIGIKDTQIETSTYYLQQRYEYNQKTQTTELVGYETIHVLSVTTTDVANVGKIIDTAVGAGANGVDSVNFELKKETQDALKKELLGAASASAKSKADAIASSLGLKIAGVKQVSESGVSVIPYIYTKAESAATPTQILPQNVEATAQVTIVYSIR